MDISMEIAGSSLSLSWWRRSLHSVRNGLIWLAAFLTTWLAAREAAYSSSLLNSRVVELCLRSVWTFCVEGKSHRASRENEENRESIINSAHQKNKTHLACQYIGWILLRADLNCYTFIMSTFISPAQAQGLKAPVLTSEPHQEKSFLMFVVVQNTR